MPTGRYDKLFTVQTPSETRVDGDVVQSWASAGTRWGRYEGLNTRELLQSDQSRNRLTGKVTLRDRFDGLTQNHRLTHNGRTFNIDAVAGGDERSTRYGQALLVVEVTP